MLFADQGGVLVEMSLANVTCWVNYQILVIGISLSIYYSMKPFF